LIADENIVSATTAVRVPAQEIGIDPSGESDAELIKRRKQE